VCPSTTIMNKGVKMAAIQPMQIAPDWRRCTRCRRRTRRRAPQPGPPPAAAAPGAPGQADPVVVHAARADPVAAHLVRAHPRVVVVVCNVAVDDDPDIDLT